MSTLIFRVVARVAFVLLLVVGTSYAVTSSGTIPLWLNAMGFVAIAVGTGVMFLNSKRTAKFFTRDVISQAQIHALSIQMVMLAVVISAIAGIHWRTLGHSLTFIDSTATVVIRVLYDLGTIGFFLTAGQFEENLSWGRLSKVAIILLVIFAGIIGLTWTDHDGLLMHEPQTVIGVPQGLRP